MNLSEIIFLVIYGLAATYSVRRYREKYKAELKNHIATLERSKRLVNDRDAIIAMYERHMTAHGMKIYKDGRPVCHDEWPEEIEN